MSIVMKNLTKSFGNPPTHVLKGISGTIENGEMISITGRSGSGKSTFLYLISTLDKPTSGDVMIDGESILSMNSQKLHQFRNQKMGFVFQFHYLLPELTSLENILMPARKTNQNKQKQSYAMELLQEFEISDKANSTPSQLSGGEQQRVAIARALILEPAYIFADEPTGNLDSASGTIVMKLLQKINREKGKTIIYVTHDREFSEMAKRQIHLVDGALS